MAVSPNAASASLTLTCSVQSSAAGSTVSNSISDGDVTFDQEGSGGTDNVSGASASNSVNSLPALTVTKSVSPTGAVNVGTNLIYTIGVSNSGQQTATNLAINDACPSGTSSISSSTATGSYSVVHGRLAVSPMPPVPPHANLLCAIQCNWFHRLQLHL
ncbi:MAG: hypothetical protein R3A11_09710 [Bdellovibrionota bacterium]